jgi:hypothetical protein
VPIAALGIALLGGRSSAAFAQTLTPGPGEWRPLAYADLRKPTPRDATFVDIWKEAIDAEDRGQTGRGDRRFARAPALAIEAHFVIWSPARSVVLSVLDTTLDCSVKPRDPETRAVVKLCPMRVAIYDGLRVRTMDAGRGCFLESEPNASLGISAAYGAYDVASRTLKIGMIVNHRPVDGCSFNVPLPRD